MPTAYKYSQVQGTASVGTFSTLYQTASATSAVISSLVVCNQASSDVTVRIGLAGSASTPAASEYLVYDAVVAGNDTVALTLGVSLPASKFVRIASSASTCNFSAFVSEIT